MNLSIFYIQRLPSIVKKDEIITWEIENLMIEKGIERLWFQMAIDNTIYFSIKKRCRNSDSVGVRIWRFVTQQKKEL
jgi:hypothetical protein